jgi:hypothetical protein
VSGREEDGQAYHHAAAGQFAETHVYTSSGRE